MSTPKAETPAETAPVETPAETPAPAEATPAPAPVPAAAAPAAPAVPENGGGVPAIPTADAEGFVGELTEQARMALGTVQRQQQDITTQIGQVELHKAQLIGNHATLQAQAKRILDSEARRMGIPNGRAWQVTPEGKARLMGG